MKKDKLIELLNRLSGNPDIYLWNGFTEDWMDIDKNFIQEVFVKEREDFISKTLMHEKMQRKGSFDLTEEEKQVCRDTAKLVFKGKKYDYPNPFLLEEEYLEWYGTKRKNVVIINAKTKGARYSDRVGSMNY